MISVLIQAKIPRVDAECFFPLLNFVAPPYAWLMYITLFQASAKIFLPLPLHFYLAYKSASFYINAVGPSLTVNFFRLISALKAQAYGEINKTEFFS